MASNCDDVIDAELEVTLLNPGGWWYRQFSVDEQGLLALFMIFLILYTATFIVLAYSRGEEILRLQRTPFALLFAAAVLMEYASLTLQTLHGVRYASNGVGLVAFQALGEITDALSDCIFMVVVIYIAKGLGQSQDMQDLPKGWLFNTGIFVTGFLSLFVLDRNGRAMDQRYCYDSDIGVVIIAYRVSAFIYFWIALVRFETPQASKRGEQHQRIIDDAAAAGDIPVPRGVFKLCCTVWFLGVPAAYVASQYVPEWDQMRLVIAVGVTLHAFGLVGLAAVVCPSLLVPGGAAATGDSMLSPYDEI